MNARDFAVLFLRACPGIGALLALSAGPGPDLRAEAPPLQPAPWRSALYPEDWKPGWKDAQGRFLHDFSYAGYRRGERPVPDAKGPVIDATQPPYSADRTGKDDATEAIQSALDVAAAGGGGVVFLPAGSYRVSPAEGTNTALFVQGDRIVLRGEGPTKTFLYTDCLKMRGKALIRVGADRPADWRAEGPSIPSSPIAEDVPNQALAVTVADASAFAAGDLVVLRSDLTQRFIDSVEMTGKWQPAGAASPNRTLMFCRRLVAVDAGKRALTLDVPVRYPMKTADLARVVKVPGRAISETGLEDFSIGMRQHPDAALGEEDYQKEGTAAWDAHGSVAIHFSNAENCWVRRVHTFAPPGNAPNVHLLSNGLVLWRSRFVTVEECDFRFSQYKGGGGNGYHYIMQGQENLVRGCRAEGGRHNYDFGTMAASGNVITGCFSKDGVHASDFHMFLSMANLLERFTCEGDFLEARYFRPWGGNPIHGVTTTQSVFWNNRGLRYSAEKKVLVDSHQLGDGYVIGTSGPCSAVDSDDFVEGVGNGESLVPGSLYADQLRRRLGAAR